MALATCARLGGEASAGPRGGRGAGPRPGCGSERGPGSSSLSVLVVDGVLLDVVLPLGRDLVLGGDRVDGARLDARVAIDALRRVYIELLGFLESRLLGRRMDAVHRADLHARAVLGGDTRLVDHVGHRGASFPLVFFTFRVG